MDEDGHPGVFSYSISGNKITIDDKTFTFRIVNSNQIILEIDGTSILMFKQMVQI